jgi:hypothetical protein
MLQSRISALDSPDFARVHVRSGHSGGAQGQRRKAA